MKLVGIGPFLVLIFKFRPALEQVVGAVVVGISCRLQGFGFLCMKGAERGRMGKGTQIVVYR